MSEPTAVPGAPSAAAPVDLDAFLERWRSLHGGVDPRATALVRRWLTGMHVLARPLVRRRVRPDVLTLVGLVLAMATVPVAALGGRWALLVAGLAVASATVDSLDGAVAVLSDRVTSRGALLDALCDRVADVALTLCLTALVVVSTEHHVGGGWLLVVTGCALLLPLLHEYVRARAAGLAMAGLDVVTVGERPSRVIVVAMFALAAGVLDQATWAWAGLLLLVGVAFSGVASLLWSLHRHNR